MDTTITIKIIAGFIALLIVLRIMGKKELTQITPVDFVYLLVLGGLMENAVYDKSVTIWQVLYSLGLWSVLIFILELLVRNFEWLRPIVKGSPSVIINEGVLNIKSLKKNKLESEQLRSMLRLQGIFSIKEVKYAILEPSGDLSVMEYERERPITADMLNMEPKETTLSHLVVDEGEIQYNVLSEINKSEEWLIDVLEEHGHKTIKDIYYAEWSESDGLIVNNYSEGNN
ncbi:DUF421 domain-containing protein [Gracilibacillus kekensis]|uniref:Uncharacterized membrane protein YcaP, DUF421 family n=1 Tax=Gracilibacillus kekensis TaxID=1027249 RepID=A0A1M7Q7V9_9BACI|nr:DUF421 domain-containing protein [Gracilibacillus kekensis]SHN26566.1 Uncharacterized membrane protein YcaP, DUF421 family [Gracilibacillus kekensis]